MSNELPPPSTRAARYVGWIDKHRHAVLILSAILMVGGGFLATRLPVYSDFSYLLPPGTQSVQDLRALEKRARVLGTLMVAVKAEDPELRRQVALKLHERFSALPTDLISTIRFDRRVERNYGWDNRWLFAPLADLVAARDALKGEIEKKTLEENPLYIDFEDAPKDAGNALAGLEELEKKLAAAKAERDDPGELVSKDGTLQMMVIMTPFPSGDVERTGRLREAAERIAAEERANFPKAEIGLAGDVVLAKAEHEAILNGMLISTLATIVLCLGALVLYYRSFRSVWALTWSLALGTVLTFAFTRLTIGHLNIATAFLSSIVIGNGINFSIMLIARHMEERRAGRPGLLALAGAVGGTFPGTLAASLTASVAYGSLVITDFRGFRHFGVIGGVGMVLCWLSAFTVLPATLALFERRGWIKVRGEPKIGHLLDKIFPRRLRLVAAFGLLATVAAGFETWRYLSNDPYEQNFGNLRSDNDLIREERRWMGEIDKAFGQGISGGFVIAVDKRENVAPLVKKLRAADEGKGEKERLFSRVNSFEDTLPADQEEKLKILAEIRGLLSDEVLASLSEADRATALELKPPETLRALRDEDVPDAIAGPFIEADGSRGKMILAMSGWGYEIWNAHDLVRFSEKVRALDLGEGTLLGGVAFVFADMLALMERDGPLTTLAAIIGAILVVGLMVGLRRHGLVTLFCGFSGSLLMLAIGSQMGLKINFLDFVALPLTIGIGIDYAVNIVSRHRQDGPGSAKNTLTTTGGAVFLCSYTTIVGYGSLLTSVNAGIRSFGTAAIIGELTCLAVALWIGPTLLALFDKRDAARAAVKTEG